MPEIENLSDDIRRKRWKFIGHILRKEPDNECRIALINIDIRHVCRNRGRPKARLSGRERERAGWRTCNEVHTAATNRLLQVGEGVWRHYMCLLARSRYVKVTVNSQGTLPIFYTHLDIRLTRNTRIKQTLTTAEATTGTYKCNTSWFTRLNTWKQRVI